MRGLLALLGLLLLAAPAHAWSELVEYRIGGSELISAVAAAPEENEAPATLTLKIKDRLDPLVLESDHDVKECGETLQYVVGNSSVYVSIVVDRNAATLNGVKLIQCAEFPVFN